MDEGASRNYNMSLTYHMMHFIGHSLCLRE